MKIWRNRPFSQIIYGGDDSGNRNHVRSWSVCTIAPRFTPVNRYMRCLEVPPLLYGPRQQPSWKLLSAHSPTSTCSGRMPAGGSLPSWNSYDVQEVYAIIRSDEHYFGPSKSVLTEPQNWTLQCGHCPTMRKAAELHWSTVSIWNWQRFLAGMTMKTVSSSRV